MGQFALLLFSPVASHSCTFVLYSAMHISITLQQVAKVKLVAYNKTPEFSQVFYQVLRILISKSSSSIVLKACKTILKRSFPFGTVG